MDKSARFDSGRCGPLALRRDLYFFFFKKKKKLIGCTDRMIYLKKFWKLVVGNDQCCFRLLDW